MKQKRLNRVKITIGFLFAGFVLLLLLTGIFFTPYNPNEMNAAAKNLPPSFMHWFGTDNFGRDIMSRVMDGGRTTLIVAISTVVIGGAFGTLIGAFTGYYGGKLDELLMRFNDIVTSFPSILLTLIMISIVGTGKYNIILVLGIIFIPSFSRVMRSEFIAYKDRDFVKNAQIMGAGNIRIMFLHIFPNTLPVLVSAVTIGFNNAVLAEAGMSFLGLGVQPPDASLGRMLAESQSYLLTAPWMAIAPGMIIILMVLGISMISEG